MEWITALVILSVVAAFVWIAANKSKPLVQEPPEDCSCMWFMNDDGMLYRSLADVNCRHHEGS